MAKKPTTVQSVEVAEDKELQVVKRNATKAMQAAEALTISSQEDMKGATELLSKINQAGDMIKQRKEAITKPLNAALKSARELFAPLEEAQQTAKSLVSRKMIAFQNQLEEERRKEQEKIEARLERGTMKLETATKKMENLPEVHNQVKSDSGAVSFRENTVITVEDVTKVPRDYLVPDMVAIRRAVLAGTEIPGIKVAKEKIISNRR